MQKLLEVAQFKAIRGNLILVIIASYTLILELVNRSPFVLNDCAVIAKKYGFKLNLGKKGLGYFSLELKFWHPRSEMSLGPYFLLLHFFLRLILVFSSASAAGRQ